PPPTRRGGPADTQRDDGALMRFHVARTALGDEAYELAREGILTDMSVVFSPVEERRTRGGVVARTPTQPARVALVAGAGAYEGAQITAVRAAAEGDMTDETKPKGDADENEEEEE